MSKTLSKVRVGQVLHVILMSILCLYRLFSWYMYNQSSKEMELPLYQHRFPSYKRLLLHATYLLTFSSLYEQYSRRLMTMTGRISRSHKNTNQRHVLW